MVSEGAITTSKNPRWIRILGVVLFCGIVVSIAVAVAVHHRLMNQRNEAADGNIQSRLGRYRTAAVSSDGVPCSTIGRIVLTDGGNAVDAAIATTLCIGVVNPQSAGIGGGFFMTLYDTKTKTARCLNARETAPAAATENMYSGNATASQKGGLSVAVPGELAGYWMAHQAYGRLPWARVILPSAALAERGVAVNRHLANALKKEAQWIKSEPSMRWIFVNETTGEVLQEGDIYKMPQLANTLRLIAQHGVDILYNGFLGKQMVEDVRRRGGILTEQDLVDYKPLWVEPIKADLRGDLTLYSIPPPGSGVLLAYIMKILDGLELHKTGSKDPLTYHRIAEAFKYAYAQRTKLGDPLFVPEVKQLVEKLISDKMAEETREKIRNSVTSNDPKFYGAVTYQPDDHGTSHMSVLDGDGMAVSITSTVNLYFGACFMSEQTGIILNDEMDDFSSPGFTNVFGLPPSPPNFIRPGKRPLSSMAPAVVVDSRTAKVRLVVGAAGGSHITTAIAYVAIRNLWFSETIKEAIDSPRLHHQLLPMAIHYEPGFDNDIVRNLTAKGHPRARTSGPGAVGRAIVCGISSTSNDRNEPNGVIEANSDYRKGGDVDGIDPLPTSS